MSRRGTHVHRTAPQLLTDAALRLDALDPRKYVSSVVLEPEYDRSEVLNLLRIAYIPDWAITGAFSELVNTTFVLSDSFMLDTTLDFSFLADHRAPFEWKYCELVLLRNPVGSSMNAVLQAGAASLWLASEETRNVQPGRLVNINVYDLKKTFIRSSLQRWQAVQL